jgi:hypothetical protein
VDGFGSVSDKRIFISSCSTACCFSEAAAKPRAGGFILPTSLADIAGVAVSDGLIAYRAVGSSPPYTALLPYSFLVKPDWV